VYSDVYEWPTAEAALAGVLQRGGDIVAEHVARCASDSAYVESIINFFAFAHDADAAPPHVHAFEAVGGNVHAAAPEAEAGAWCYMAQPAETVASSSMPPQHAAGAGEIGSGSRHQLDASRPAAGAVPVHEPYLERVERIACWLERAQAYMAAADLALPEVCAPAVPPLWRDAHVCPTCD
jgi:hypothetical protein